jgi:hypothetical protein
VNTQLVYNVILAVVGTTWFGSALMFFLTRRRFRADVRKVEATITTDEANTARIITETSSGLLKDVNAQLAAQANRIASLEQSRVATIAFMRRQGMALRQMRDIVLVLNKELEKVDGKSHPVPDIDEILNTDITSL